jgi:hypothetical protein
MSGFAHLRGAEEKGGGQMTEAAGVAGNLLPTGAIPQTERQAREPRPVTVQRDHVRLYLVALSRLALEVSRNPRLLPSFIHIVARVPRTIEQLRTRRLAA